MDISLSSILLEGIYPDWDKRMFENKYYFERWYNEFGSHGNILT